MSILEEIVGALSDTDRNSKMRKLSDLELFMDYGFGRRQDVSNKEFVRGISLLVKAALEEKDEDIRKEILPVISQALTFHSIGEAIDFDPLVTNVPLFMENEIEYILYFFGYSENKKYIPFLEQYKDSSVHSIRTSAREALQNLSHLP